MSTPSKRPAAAPVPPEASPATPVGRLPLRNMLMQDDTNALRDASVAAASEKYLEYVQPPRETRMRRFGYFAFSSRSWLKLPLIGCDQVSEEPSTLIEESYDFW